MLLPALDTGFEIATLRFQEACVILTSDNMILQICHLCPFLKRFHKVLCLVRLLCFFQKYTWNKHCKQCGTLVPGKRGTRSQSNKQRHVIVCNMIQSAIPSHNGDFFRLFLLSFIMLSFPQLIRKGLFNTECANKKWSASEI